MNTDFDAIVIGAGMGGMCAAARLSAVGKRVLVLEKSAHLGGRCSHRLRDEHIVTTGALMIPMGRSSAIRQAFDALGVEMDMVDLTGKMRYRLDHGDYDISATGGGLYGMIAFAMQDEAQASAFYKRITGALTGWTPLSSISIRDWFDQYTDNEPVKNLFNGYCAALMGVNMHEIPANEFFNFLKYHSKGSRFGMARLGNGALMTTLETAITANGSCVLRHARCRKILVEDGCAKGVEIGIDGDIRQYAAPLVISNIGPDATVTLAGGEAQFERSYIERLHTDAEDAPIYHVSFVMDRPVMDNFSGCMVLGNTRNLIYLEIPSAISPAISPAGGYLHTAYGAPADVASTDMDRDFAVMMEELEQNFPGVGAEATFLVKARHRGESPGMRRWIGRGMPVNTPIRGLYNVGDGCAPSGAIGTEGAAVSARLAVEHIAGCGL